MTTILWLIRMILDSTAAFFAGKKARDDEIAVDNKAALEKARIARLDVRKCHEEGRYWNQRTGRCE